MFNENDFLQKRRDWLIREINILADELKMVTEKLEPKPIKIKTKVVLHKIKK